VSRTSNGARDAPFSFARRSADADEVASSRLAFGPRRAASRAACPVCWCTMIGMRAAAALDPLRVPVIPPNPGDSPPPPVR